jgi:hypothetical protein
MKHAFLILLVVLVAVSTCFAYPETGKTEVGGDFWFRYHIDRMDESTQRSAFTVERGYIGLGYGWNSDVNGQMTINVFSSQTSSGVTGWDFELRDAYLNLNYFVPNGKIRVGLQKNYFGTVHDWKYMTVRRSLADAVGVVQERDYGVAFLGSMPDGMGEWSLAVMNGEGFSSGFNPVWADKQPGLMGTVRYIPMRETVIGVSYLRDKRYVYRWDTWGYESDARIGYEDRTAYSVMARWGTGPFSVLGEYLYYDYAIPDREEPEHCTMNVTGSGFSVFPMIRLTEKFDVVGRYDTWDPDTDSDETIWSPTGTGFTSTMWNTQPWWLPSDYAPEYYLVKHNVYTVGFNYNITERMEGAPGVIIQANWQRMSADEDIYGTPLEDVDSYIVQVRWGWGGLDF